MTSTKSWSPRWAAALTAVAVALAACGDSSSVIGAPNGVGGSPVANPPGGSNPPPAPVGAPPQCVASAGTVPTVIGPIASDPVGSASRNYPWMATDVDLAGNRYIEEEFFICGTSVQGGGAYATRMIVRRPIDSKDFQGTVFAEFLNDTTGSELDLLWAQSAAHMMRKGYAYVGIAAQRYAYYAAPYGLALWSPLRYGQMKWPGGNTGGVFTFVAGVPYDLTSYDIYTQALQSLRSRLGADPMGGLPPKKIVATGGSGSAGAIEIYYMTQHLAARAADGFMPFIISTGSTGDHPTDVAFPVQPELVGTPLFVINSETDLDLSKKADSALYRQWEVAGATHYDDNTFQYNRRLQKRDFGIDLADADAACSVAPRSRIPFKHVLNAATDAMVRWLDSGMPPASQPRFAYNLDGSEQRDARGNIVGGIRLPEQAVPTAKNSRDNAPASCFLYGSHTPFDAATLKSLYSSRADYLLKFDAAADAAVATGALLPLDAAASKTAARETALPL